MYDSLQGVLPRDAFRGAGGRGRSTWSNSPGALRAFAPVLHHGPFGSPSELIAQLAQLMGKEKKDKNMLKEMDGKKILRYDQN